MRSQRRPRSTNTRTRRHDGRPNGPAVDPATLLRVPTVAARLSCSVRHVWTEIAAGRLSAVRLGRRSTRVREADLRRYVQQLPEWK